jgi:hypothetical protein
MNRVRVIAFYLPQFHPIKENDEHWGKGFTEWTNVGKAKPLFHGHYQPRVPADLGYYDLRVPEVREAQAEMARNAGIEGFMYWHYWFGNNKRLLERPFTEVLQSGKPDYPFCLGWANHSWTTKTWTTLKQFQNTSVIVEQLYPGEEDYINHFNSVLPAFKDKRYLRYEEEPIFLLYDPLAVPDIKEFIQLWKNLAIKNGLKGIHFVGLANGWIENSKKVLDVGFDAVAQSNLWHAESKVKGKYWKILKNIFRQNFNIMSFDKYHYKDIIKYLITEWDYKENVYPSAIPQWDRSPRSGKRAVIYYGSTPLLFKKHLQGVMQAIENKADKNKIIFLRSWNEWGEGNYIEPDLKYGSKYIDALKEELQKK